MNFEDKVLALFDNGRRSAVYVAGYQSARAQVASIAAEADRLIAEMAVENADLRGELKSRQAELERVRALPDRWLRALAEEANEMIEGRGSSEAAETLHYCVKQLQAALASPAAGITGTEQCVNGGTCGAGGFCDECEISPDSQQLDIEDQIKEGGRVMDEFSQGVFFAASVLVRIHDLPTEAADILNEAGLVKADVSSLDDYEKEAMRELVKSEGSRLNFIGLEAGHE